VERDGEYRFHLGSDDGSRLYVDGKAVVNNDGLHGTVWEQGSVKLTKGAHKVTVTFFQVGGGAELEVRVGGPGLAHQDLAGLVAPTEAALEKPPTPAKKDDADDALDVQPALAEEGKALFLAVGCANCHYMQDGGKAIELTRKATEYLAMKADGG